ncbi:hypothetical protein KIN20_022627 [Parelaphostrongylus tenuis]|uniref:Uncharacterized protein n=1 Tax=Parelaphostrongylus tenuis TaxID=148309 RepID=A0AAD5QVG1_PARTN|nr:hypothetical protein KIN20_022627 [Parelaphostrongylus tenuis]
MQLRLPLLQLAQRKEAAQGKHHVAYPIRNKNVAPRQCNDVNYDEMSTITSSTFAINFITGLSVTDKMNLETFSTEQYYAS